MAAVAYTGGYLLRCVGVCEHTGWRQRLTGGFLVRCVGVCE